MADGVYSGRFSIDVDGGGTSSGLIVTLEADHWRLTGFTVTNGTKGIMALGANHTMVDGVRVHHIGDEAIHFRDNSSDNVVGTPRSATPGCASRATARMSTSDRR